MPKFGHLQEAIASINSSKPAWCWQIHNSADQVTGHRLWKVEEDPHLFWLIINWALKFPAITRHTKIPLENPVGVEIKSWGCWETTMKAISKRKDTTWHRSQELKKKMMLLAIGWKLILMIWFQVVRLGWALVSQHASSVVSDRRYPFFFFAFGASSFWMASGPLGVCLANMNGPVLLAGSSEFKPRGLIHLLGFVKPQEKDGV